MIKENEQIIRAFMNGKILRNNLSGKCDSIHFSQRAKHLLNMLL